ncbi:prohead protease [Lactobacillus phage Lbab1]|nr:prohead protease [Lactobacillus phage Lbab1]
MNRDIDILSVFVPLVAEKSDKGKSKDWYISGLASTPDKDFQNEVILPDAIDYKSYFMNNGWITYEHGHNVEDIIGEPEDAYIDDDGFHVKAKLYKESPRAKQVWSLQNILSKESSKNRSLGFSIEGPILKRDPLHPNVITKIQIKNITVTSHPANSHATWEIATKSLDDASMIGYDIDPDTEQGLSALRKESVASAIAMLTYTMGKDNSDDILCKAQDELDSTGLSSKNTNALILQLGRGLSHDDAIKCIESIEGD